MQFLTLFVSNDGAVGGSSVSSKNEDSGIVREEGDDGCAGGAGSL